MSSTAVQLPHWDMTVVFPGLESSEFATDFGRVITRVDDLATLFDRLHIEKRDGVTVDEGAVAAFDTAIEQMNTLFSELATLHAYIYSFISTDSRNDLAQARASELQQHLVRLAQLETRFIAWIGSLDVEVLIARSTLAQDHAYVLRKAREQSNHLMSPAEENLAAELSVTGASAWAKLHGNVTSQLTVPLQIDGRREDVPMSVVRNMAHDANRDNRHQAYEAELEAWKRVAVPLAGALNSIKGEANALDGRRRWDDAIDVALFINNIDRQTLNAMMDAARAAFPDFRRYLRAKARALGLTQLTWYDLFAPVGRDEKAWDFDEARAFIVAQFGSYSSRLSDFADRAFRERWIDAEPRPGKRDGAFCMPLRRDESRILANYMPSYDAVATLAHELGHGYHNFNLANRTPLQRETPMTLAETASIFCETIIKEAALQQADVPEQIAILEAAIQNACQVVVDITSRFLFEKGVFERRRERELSVDELNELMLETQRQTYGDGLDGTALHPYMWAVKGHYYRPGQAFYNFPYMFGLLFGLGLYARYQQEPEQFKAGYDDLLSSTGLADAATLAARFGIDIRMPDFWSASLDIVRADIDRFEALIDFVGAVS